MSAWLLEISFGPVQGFIAAARRSADLWAGSYMLSEIVRAAAVELQGQGGQLIYPVASRVEARSEANADENSNLSNILLACIDAPDEEAVRVVADAVKRAARGRLERFADEARDAWESAGVKVRTDFWRHQVKDAIEAYAAWAQIPEHDEAPEKGGRTAYRVAYDGLKRTLAARKNTRDFAPMADAADAEKGAGVPKCSFDGLRESVLPDRRHLPADRRKFPARFHVSPGEQLDALGCIKRVVGRDEGFTAFTRFAADGWLSQLDEPICRALGKAYEPLVHELSLIHI